MELRFALLAFLLNSQPKIARTQDNLLQYLIEQTNFLVYNSSSIIEDTTNYLPSYDFIIIGSGSGGWRTKSTFYVCRRFKKVFLSPIQRFSDGESSERERQVEDSSAGGWTTGNLLDRRSANSIRQLSYSK